MTIVPTPSPDADLVDRKYLSQFDTQQVGFVVSTYAGPVDADANVVTATMTSDVNSSVVFSRSATRLDVGTYAVTLASSETANPGPYSVTFSYAIGGTPDHYALAFEVGSRAPDYDSLPIGMKMVVEQVWIRFADLFDSPLGGPNLQVYAQTKFGRNRLAQLLGLALGRLNTISQPQMTFTLAKPFPFDQWGPVLVQALFVEVIKHLRRSYVEMPDLVLGTTISRADRRDYMDRWGVILTDEQEDLKLMLEDFKMAYMGLGNVSVRVSGGVFGRFGPVGWAGGSGQAAARGYYFGGRLFG